MRQTLNDPAHPNPSAEDAYLFRHALLRDAAYQLQLPGDRAKLHALAFAIIEQLHGGRAPEAPPLDAVDPPKPEPHSTDSVAAELANHARLAMGEGETLGAEFLLYLRRAAEHAERVFRIDEAIKLWQEFALFSDGAIRAAALLRAGADSFDVGQSLLSEKLMEQALVIARQQGHLRLEISILGAFGTLLLRVGRPAEGERVLEQNLDLARVIGDKRFEGNVLARMAVLYRETGRLNQSKQANEEAVAVARASGFRPLEGTALGNLANVYYEEGRLNEALDAQERALAIHREVGNRRAEGNTLTNLANIRRELGDNSVAERLFEQALIVSRETCNRRGEGLTLLNLGNLYLDKKMTSKAEVCFGRSLEIAREIADARFEGAALCFLACLYAATSRPSAGRDSWKLGETKLREAKDAAELERQTLEMRAACAQAGLPCFDEEEPTPTARI